MDPEKPVEVPDELEAFFNVLIYDGVRFMQHNLSVIEVHSFFRNYFDGSQITEKGEVCGPVKWSSIYTATLGVAPNVLRFGADGHHVLNDLIAKMLSLFQARLKVYQWNTQKPLPAQKKLRLEPENQPLESLEDLIQRQVEGRMDTDIRRKPEEASTATVLEKPSADLSEPDTDTIAKAAQLRSHKCFRDLIADHLDLPGWPRNDRSSVDQMDGYNPETFLETMEKAAKSMEQAARRHYASG